MKFQALLLLTSLALASGSVVQPVIYSDCLAVDFDTEVYPQMQAVAEQIFGDTSPESTSTEPGDPTPGAGSRRLKEGDRRMLRGQRRLGVCPKDCDAPANIDKCERLNCYSSTGRRLTSGNNWSVATLSEKLNQKAGQIGKTFDCQIIVYVDQLVGADEDEPV
jgi:hypothetical protein